MKKMRSRSITLTSRSLAFSIFTILIFSFSCQKQNESTLPLNVDNATDIGVFDLSIDSSNIKIKTLSKAPSQPILAYTTNYEHHEGQTFIQDGKLHNLHIYGEDGQINTVIESTGQGPKEFVFIEAFCLNKEKREVVIYDSRLGKIIKFDYQGNFIEEQKHKLFMRSLTKVDNGWLAINAQNSFAKNEEYVIRLKENLDVDKGIKNQEVKFSTLVADINPFSFDGKSIFMNEPFSNTVYRYNQSTNTFTPEFTVDFGKNSIPAPNSYPSMRKFHRSINNKDGQGWIRDLKLVNNNLVLFKYIVYSQNESSRAKQFLFNKQKDSSIVFDSFRYKGLDIPTPKESNGNEMYSIIMSEDIEAHLEGGELKEADKIFWKSVIPDLENTNAVAITFMLK